MAIGGVSTGLDGCVSLRVSISLVLVRWSRRWRISRSLTMKLTNARTDASTAYDTVAYPSHCCPQAHPDRLATLATLFGMAPAPVERCRFLELGCGDGHNLLALAF